MLYSSTDQKKFFNPDYKINEIKKNILSLFNNNIEVGLHAGYENINNLEGLISEKKLLKQITGINITANRFHSLNFKYPTTFDIIEQSKIEYDSTLGFNNFSGFYNSYANIFKPYNIYNNKIYSYYEIPMVIMDIQFFRYNKFSKETASNTAITILNKIKKFNGFISINFHSDGFSKDYNWDCIYEDLLLWLKLNCAISGSIKYCIEKRKQNFFKDLMK